MNDKITGDFAFYKLPSSHKINSIIGKWKNFEFGDFGWLMRAFDECSPRQILIGEKQQWTLEQWRKIFADGKEDFIQYLEIEESKAAYAHAFAHVKSALNDNQAEKVVLARTTDIKVDKDAESIGFRLFIQACENYPESMVALARTVNGTVWCGASTEVLLEGCQEKYRTMALAGTMIKKEGEEWNEKNLKEQSFVSEYIQQELGNAEGIQCQKVTDRDLVAGQLTHRCSEFELCLGMGQTWLDVAEKIHPTPAVCGVPKNIAKKIILESESFPREFYSGYWGAVNGTECQLYVNLRCVKIDSTTNKIRFYGGGGLLQQSKMDEEWKETELKIDTMRSLFKRIL